jgi:ABC-type multidrug transport system fused ATPase/permease subunit
MPAGEERSPGPVMDAEPLPGSQGPLKGSQGLLRGGQGPLRGGQGPLRGGQERIRTEDLWYSYQAGLPTERLALCGLDLSIGRGELVGLVGPIGSGKSTLVQHLNGLLRPSRDRCWAPAQKP